MSQDLLLLNQRNLSSAPQQLSVPTYDRSALSTGIVHIGVGGFHRAHQAFYCHQLMSQSMAKDWAITGIGLLEYDRKIYEALTSQDGLYTLTVQSPNGDAHTDVIGSIREMFFAIDTPELVLARMSQASTKIISMTITEGGYSFNPNTGEFNFDNPSVVHDLAHPQAPQSIFGYITEALRRRRDSNAGPVTILSCDNVQHNGDVTKMVITTFCQRQDPALCSWIDKNVSFPNSMVDRITPKTSSETISYIREEFGIIDACPVNCEPFIQWIIEDNFISGRPPFEEVGVQFVDDVTPYEEMKLRLLNAGHSVVGITGAIHGYPTIYKCLEDEILSSYLRRYLDVEATPALSPVDGINIEQYKDTLIERFANPNIKDSVSRICSESSAKLPKFILPTILKNLESGGSIRLGTLIIATWCYYHDKGINQRGEALEIIDALAGQLARHAKKTSEDPLAFLKQPELFGKLVDNERFTEVYREVIEKIYAEEDILEVMLYEMGVSDISV